MAIILDLVEGLAELLLVQDPSTIALLGQVYTAMIHGRTLPRRPLQALMMAPLEELCPLGVALIARRQEVIDVGSNQSDGDMPLQSRGLRLAFGLHLTSSVWTRSMEGVFTRLILCIHVGCCQRQFHSHELQSSLCS